MKKINFLMIAMLLIGVVTLSSCKKENQIEKNLWKGDGTWNIDVWDEQATSTYFDDDNYTVYKINAGVIKFNKDGSGSIQHDDGITRILYENTDKLLTIIYTDDDDDDYDDDDERHSFEMEWEKDNMKLKSFTSTTYSTDDISGGTVNVTYTHRLHLDLTKK